MTASHRHRVATVALVVALIAVPAASAHVAAQSSGEIGSCTTIDQSGTYTLTNDIGANASGEACLTISASDVTLDGNGNAIENTGGAADTGVLVRGQNAVLRDVSASGWVDGVSLDDAFAAAVEDSTLTGNQNGVSIERTTDATVTDTELTGNDVGLYATDSQVTLTNVDVTSNANGVQAGLSTVTVERSSVSDNDANGITIDSAGVTVDRTIVQNNGNHGVSVTMPESATIRYSIFGGNGGDGVHAEGGQVDARENWWGAESGPSGNVEDPATGRLADGDGDSVSEGQNAGVSNVRFDPYYVTDPQTGDGTLVGEEPTTDAPTEEPTTGAPDDDSTDQQTAEPTDTESGDGTDSTDETDTSEDASDDADDDAGAGDDSAGGSDTTSDADTTSDSETTEQSATDQSSETSTSGAEQTSAEETTTAPSGTDASTTTTASENGTDVAAGPGAPVNETTDGGNDTLTDRVVGGENTTTSSGTGPGFGVLAALVALVAAALLVRRD